MNVRGFPRGVSWTFDRVYTSSSLCPSLSISLSLYMHLYTINRVPESIRLIFC